MPDTLDPALLADLLDLLPDLYFYIHDYDLRVVYVNKAAADHFALPKDQLVGRALPDLENHADSTLHFHSLCRHIMDRARPHTTVDPLPIKAPDGSTRYYRRHDIPFRHPATGDLMLMGLAQDVTHEIDLQRQREQLAAVSRELQIARDIHQSLRPAPLSLPWLDLAGMSTPATAAGGDFYDWSLSPDGSVTLALGDVTGHGVGPALLASAARASWRALAPTLPLQDAVLRLNDLLSPDLTHGRFITLATARLHPDGHLELFSAGHGPNLLRRSTGHVESFPSHAPPLGLLDTVPPDEPTHLHLTPNDTLLLTSDGLLELRNPANDQYTPERLTTLLSTTPATNAQTLLNTINTHNLTFAQSTPPADDRTLVLATHRPTARP